MQTNNNGEATAMLAALERAELYYAAYPGGPAAVRRPRIFQRSGTWIALLGDDLPRGIAGFGPTVESALRAFDRRYLNALHPPGDPAIGRAA
jgi:hypothetical protein